MKKNDSVKREVLERARAMGDGRLYWLVLRNLGREYEGQVRFDAASACFTLAGSMSLRDQAWFERERYHVHEHNAQCLIKLERFAEAATAARRAIRTNPEKAGAHLLLGQALMGQGRLRAAVRSFRRALDLSPGDSRAAHHLKIAEERLEREGA